MESIKDALCDKFGMFRDWSYLVCMNMGGHRDAFSLERMALCTVRFRGLPSTEATEPQVKQELEARWTILCYIPVSIVG